MAQIAKDIFIENGYGSIKPKDFKTKILVRTGRIAPSHESKTPGLTEFLDLHLAEMKRTYKPGSYISFANAINRVKEFINYAYRRKIDYDDVDWNFRQKLVAWSYEVKKHSPAQTNKILAIFSQYLNEANKLGYHNNTIYRIRGWREKVKGDKATPVAFTLMEVERLASMELEGITKKVRDLALIGIFTGQRWSDFHRYKPEHFVIDGREKLLHVRQQKTGAVVFIPLDLFDGIVKAKTLRGLFEEYEFRSPKVSYPYFNIAIKKLCKKMELNYLIPGVDRRGGGYAKTEIPKWEAVGSHCCRRTFCTLLYRMDVSPAMIKGVSGHKTESEFYKYIGVTAKDTAHSLAAEMRKLRGESPLRAVK